MDILGAEGAFPRGQAMLLYAAYAYLEGLLGGENMEVGDGS